ncbi:MAG: hypothetical protein HYV63_09045 [Candidatus Schekmanbacteria bacterium]|nr:hypothetical protein [Candidatus Schekmanbacteria bacterium]
MILGVCDRTTGPVEPLADGSTAGRASPRGASGWRAVGNFCALTDCWLDNRAELTRALCLPPQCADEELIAHAYGRWGAECPRRLLGDFAVAVWDTASRELFLARDPIGARPLVYCVTAGRVAFASDVESLDAAGGMPRRLNEPVLAAYLQRPAELLPGLGAATFWDGVRKLPAGHALTVCGQDARLRRWQRWEDAPEIRFKRDDEYAETLRDGLETAVDRCISGAARIGAHVSGGVDSSAVAVLAARALTRQGRALTAGYTWLAPPDVAHPDGDDTHAAAALLAAELGVPLRSQRLSAAAIVRTDLVDFTRFPVHMMRYERTVLAQARADGVGVILTGWGGDELVTSRRWAAWFELLRQGRWGTAWRESRLHAPRRRRGWLRDVASWLLRDVLGAVGLPGPLTSRSSALAFVALPYIDAAFNRAILSDPLLAPLGYAAQPGGFRSSQLATLIDTRLTHRVESWAAAGAALGIRYRYPLLDRELVELCLGMPPEQFIRHGMERSLFRRALAGRVPEAILSAPKRAESQRVRRLVRCADEAILELVRRARLVDPPRLFEWIDYPAMKRLLASDPVPHSTVADVRERRGFAHRQAALITLLSADWQQRCR